MMQDYPKALPSSAAVGFTVVNQVRFAIALLPLPCPAVPLNSSVSLDLPATPYTTYCSPFVLLAFHKQTHLVTLC